MKCLQATLVLVNFGHRHLIPLHISTYFLTKNKNYQVDGDAEESSHMLAMVQTVAFIA
jgi:hypothetical protein